MKDLAEINTSSSGKDTFASAMYWSKVVLLSLWVVVLVYLAYPNILSEFNINTLSAKSAEVFAEPEQSGNLGLVLEPLSILPTVQEDNIYTTVATNPAENLSGYEITGSFSTSDFRVLALERFLYSKNSPMAPHAALIVAKSDEAGINYKTFIAISGVESGYGRAGRAARVGHNPIGWRGGPGGAFSEFPDWPAGISYLVPRLAHVYGGDPNPYAIQSTYCPPCGAAGTNEWANGVTRNMSEIEGYYGGG